MNAIDSDTGTVKLDELLACLDGAPLRKGSCEGVVIKSVTDDSRSVGSGALFVAVRGGSHDGHDFIGDAVARGAAAVVAETGAEKLWATGDGGPVLLVVGNSRDALARLASAFFRHPASEMTMIGITGTNGKTTVSYLLGQALEGFGLRTGVIGTVEYRYTNERGETVIEPAPLTTPDPVTLFRMLREMADNGVTHVVMEASSHALAQERLGPIRYTLAVFTNFSQDHLDYHLTMEEYFTAKCLLFSRHMATNGTVVVVEQNGQESGVTPPPQRVADLCRSLSLKTVVCGESADADFRLTDSTGSLAGVTCTLSDSDGKTHHITSPLLGWFNINNLHATFAALFVLGFDADQSAALLGSATGAPGRIERINLAEKITGQPTVVVDYAHTPDALEKVLTALTDIDHDTLYCLVGCGGNRDTSKRFLMGDIAARLADVVIVTDDNPRRENPAAIREAIVAGVAHGGATARSREWLASRRQGERGYLEIGDRREAIDVAVTSAGPGDIVLIAGKGHETYQIVGDRKRFFNDALYARQSSLKWDLRTVAAAVGGTIAGGDPRAVFAGVSTDSRTIGKGDIFVALTGDQFDGHDFIEKAVDSGAGCVIASEPGRVKPGVCWVAVEDTLTALGDLAAHRLHLVRKLGGSNRGPVVVGLTGSCGKTTVKEMTAAIFACHWPDRDDQPAGRVLKTAGNFNNLIGLPLSLLPVSAHHRGLVLEMGMNRPGEIARLTQISDPDICCITNVYKAHLEGLGSIEGVAAAKGELFEKSRADAVHIVNYDDDHIVGLSTRFSRRTITFAVTEKGLNRNPQVWAEAVGADAAGNLSLILHVDNLCQPVTIQAPGLHNAANCCAAAAIAHAAGIDLETMVCGLEQFRSGSNRMERLVSPGGLNLLNDCYNANPASTASALRTLAGLQGAARGAVLGDMLELGEASGDLHRFVGTVAAQSDLLFLAVVGTYAEQIRQGAVASGMDPERIRYFPDKSDVAAWLGEKMQAGALHPGDWVLVKASRGLALDTVVAQIMNIC